MVNSDFGPAFILGIALILSGVALYGMRSFRPELSRDHDIFFAAIALVSGLILMFQGWRLDPLLFLGQLSLAGSAAFFAFENIRLRGVTTEQAKRNTPIVDDERPVSRRYEYDYDAEFDELPYAERRASSRRIREGRDVRGVPFDDYQEDPRRRASSSRRRRIEPEEEYPPSYEADARSRRRLPYSRRRDEERPIEPVSAWEEPARDEWDARSSQPNRQTWDVRPPEVEVKPINDVNINTNMNDSSAPERGSTYRSGGREPKSLSRYRRRRTSSSDQYSYRKSPQGDGDDYADYQPLNSPEDDLGANGDYGDR